MSSKQRHEYELKFRVGTVISDITTVRSKISAAGFISGKRAIETDYLPDTPTSDCKKAGILLRFRQVVHSNSRELLLTLKIRQADSGMLHFHEYETDLCAADQTIIDKINNLLQIHIGLTINDSVLQVKNLEEVREAAKLIGFTKHRILLSKYRENFSLGKDNVTIDYFPDGMGVYVEFESHSATALRHSINLVGFDKTDGIDTDYGDLLKLHKADLPDQKQRTAVFAGPELEHLYNMIKESNDD